MPVKKSGNFSKIIEGQEFISNEYFRLKRTSHLLFRKYISSHSLRRDARMVLRRSPFGRMGRSGNVLILKVIGEMPEWSSEGVPLGEWDGLETF
jgi:hypothetical protein